MCRLLGYCARDHASLADLMGEASLSDFSALSAFHRDGWGMAWYDGPQLLVEKSPLRAIDEPAYDKLAHQALGDVGLLHLRMATPGLPVEMRNTHPFARGGYAMAHNGAVLPLDRIGELLPAAWEQQLTGTTDSERYFLHVMSGLEAHGDAIAALSSTVADIDRRFAGNSLNAILVGPDALYAVCCYHPERIPRDGLSMRGYEGPPERYFDLAYRVTPDAVVVASSGWPQDGWSYVPNRHVMVVDRGTLRVSMEPLPPANPAKMALREPLVVTPPSATRAARAAVPA
jgi:predicted glutamine amidotransferase